MYLTIEQARTEIRKRRQAPELERRVLDYLGEIPSYLRREPRAVLARQLATPNFETIRFAEAAARSGLRPICPEFRGDKFCSKNPDKKRTGKLTFHHGWGRNRGEKTSSRRVIDFSRYDGVPYASIRTDWGESFTAFHHRLLHRALPAVEIADNTLWLRRMGGCPDQFWPCLLALFLCHGVLFDNFHAEGHESRFTRDIIEPSLKEITERFGLRPLIVSLVPVETEREPYWSWYPGFLEEEIPGRRQGKVLGQPVAGYATGGLYA